MDLHEHASGDTGSERLAIDKIQKSGGIDTLDHGSMADELADLIGLEMTDKMPPDVIGELRDLGEEFLDTAFAETALTGLADSLNGVELRDSHKADTLRELIIYFM